MRMTQPLFRFDPGWLYIVAGLVLCVAGVLIPAQRDLFTLNQQLHDLRAQEQHLNQRLRAHAKFLIALDEDEPVVTRRLVEAQLNLAPAGDTPVLLASGRTGAVSDWIESTVPEPQRDIAAWPDSILTTLATGPYRLWLLGGGVLCVFMGLLTTPALSRRHIAKRRVNEARRRATEESAANVFSVPNEDELANDDATIVEEEVDFELTTASVDETENVAADVNDETTPDIVTHPNVPLPTVRRTANRRSPSSPTPRIEPSSEGPFPETLFGG